MRISFKNALTERHQHHCLMLVHLYGPELVLGGTITELDSLIAEEIGPQHSRGQVAVTTLQKLFVDAIIIMNSITIIVDTIIIVSGKFRLVAKGA